MQASEQSIGLDSNDVTIEAWDGVLFDKFARFREVLTRGLGAHGDAAIRWHVGDAARVLDVGCGFGDTTIAIARAGASLAVGIDAASRFVAAARADAEQQGVENVRFEIGDVQLCDLGGPYDLAFSRFGTMFFARPLAALRNMRKALAPGGKLCSVVWRKREDNPFFYVPQRIAESLVPPPEVVDEPTCGPGPFSMASADFVSDLVRSAGFTRVALERHDAPIRVGRDLEEAVEFALELGPAGELLRLSKATAKGLRPKVAEAIRAALEGYASPDGVWLDSSTWIVTAVAP